MGQVPLRDELRARARQLSPRSSLPEAARTLTCLWAREMETDLPMALRTLRPAPLHDARVESRRLRAAASLFQGMYPATWERAATMAREVTRCLRTPRDLDIRGARLRRLIKARGRSGRKDRADLARMLDETVTLRGSLINAPGPGAGKLMAPLLQELWRPRVAEAPSAQRLVWVILKELAHRTEFLIPPASVEPLGGVQHRLRISGKALRYSLEMMEWQLGEEASWRIKVLQRAQDVLGELHDIDVFVEYLEDERKGRARRGPGVRADTMGVLGEQRGRWFGRFLDLRPELENACDLAAVRGRARTSP